MARRGNWSPEPKLFIEPVRDSEFKEALAEIAEIIYSELRSRQLRDQSAAAIAAKPVEIASQLERKVANA
jgi:hypothetical protein